MLASTETEQAAAKAGGIAAYLPPAQLGRSMAQEANDWGKLIKSQNIATQ